MGLLLGLGLFQRVVGRAEIGAGVLLVLIEKEPVEIARKIVVMRHVLLRPVDRCHLLQPAKHALKSGNRKAPGLGATLADIDRQQGQKPRDIVVAQGKGAVHVAFAKAKIGIAHDAAQKAGIVDRHFGTGTDAVAEASGRSVGHVHHEKAVTHDARGEPFEKLVPHPCKTVSCRFQAKS